MKILNIARRFSFDEWGGTETVIWNTAKYLKKKEHETEILSTNALSNTGNEIKDNIQIMRFPYFYPHFPLSQKNIIKLDKKGGNPFSLKLLKYILEQKNIDILHSHTMARMAETVRSAAEKKNIPYVISFHGGLYDVPKSEIIEMLKPLKGSFNYGKFIDIFMGNGRYLEKSNGIITVGYNEFLKVKEKFPEKQIMYIPNGVEIEKFNRVRYDENSKQDFKKKYNIDIDSFLILCVSRIDYQKNQKLLIELMKELKKKNKKVHLLLIGPITAPDYFLEIQKKIISYGLKENITIIKGLKHDSSDLIEAFKYSDIFMLPSIHEPFGIVILEAWASGIPVMAARTGGIKKLIRSNETGVFFDQTSIKDLLEKFLLLAENTSHQKQLVENGKKEVYENYSWDRITEKLLGFYQNVINKFKNGK